MYLYRIDKHTFPDLTHARFSIPIDQSVLIVLDNGTMEGLAGFFQIMESLIYLVSGEANTCMLVQQHIVDRET